MFVVIVLIILLYWRSQKRQRQQLEIIPAQIVIMPVVQEISAYREAKINMPVQEAKIMAREIVEANENLPTFAERIRIIDFMEDEDMDVALTLQWAYDGARDPVTKHIVRDPQNVHDSNVLYDIYEQTQSSLPPVNENEMESVLALPWIPQDIKTLWQSRNFAIKDMTELNHATRVWNQLKSRPKGIEAMQDAINGCYENGALVCSMGRIARIHGALVGQTQHEDLGVVRTKGALRQTFYSEVAKLRDETPNEEELVARIRNLAVKYENVLPDIDYLVEETITYI